VSCRRNQSGVRGPKVTEADLLALTVIPAGIHVGEAQCRYVLMAGIGARVIARVGFDQALAVRRILLLPQQFALRIGGGHGGAQVVVVIVGDAFAGAGTERAQC
jgi:hypothetical protein